jgi:hypothetical protein
VSVNDRFPTVSLIAREVAEISAVALLVLIVSSGRVSQGTQSRNGLGGGDGVAAQDVEAFGLQR